MWHLVFVKMIDNLYHVLHSYKTTSDILKESEMTSSLHGLYGPGYTRATMAIIIGKALRQSESRKMALIRIVLCNLRT